MDQKRQRSNQEGNLQVIAELSGLRKEKEILKKALAEARAPNPALDAKRLEDQKELAALKVQLLDAKAILTILVHAAPVDANLHVVQLANTFLERGCIVPGLLKAAPQTQNAETD